MTYDNWKTRSPDDGDYDEAMDEDLGELAMRDYTKEIDRRMGHDVLTKRPISHGEARESAQRLINSHFGAEPQAHVSIPANPDGDDDLIIMAYIAQRQSND